MNPIVTLAAGAVLGALGVRYGLRRDPRAAIRSGGQAGTALLRDGIDRAGDQLRGAAISGLSAVEAQSGALRQRLEGAAPEAQEPTDTARRTPRKVQAGAAGSETSEA